MDSPSITTRGDRNQRRVDVLTAATAILEESGWAGLSMREVAARAGVSAGATYQWFSGKDEIYAELYTARLASGIDAMNTVRADIGLEELLIGVFGWVAETWRDLGRWQLELAEASRTGPPTEAATALADTHRRLLDVGVERMTRAAATDGRVLRADPDLAHLVWATASGIAMRADVLGFEDERLARMQRTAVRALAAGLFETP